MVAAVDVVHSALSVGVPDPLLCRRVKRFPVLRIPFAQAVAIVMADRGIAARFIPCHGLNGCFTSCTRPSSISVRPNSTRRRIQTAPRVSRAPGRPAPAADTVRCQLPPRRPHLLQSSVCFSFRFLRSNLLLAGIVSLAPQNSTHPAQSRRNLFQIRMPRFGCFRYQGMDHTPSIVASRSS